MQIFIAILYNFPCICSSCRTKVLPAPPSARVNSHVTFFLQARIGVPPVVDKCFISWSWVVYFWWLAYFLFNNKLSKLLSAVNLIWNWTLNCVSSHNVLRFVRRSTILESKPELLEKVAFKVYYVNHYSLSVWNLSLIMTHNSSIHIILPHGEK